MHFPVLAVFGVLFGMSYGHALLDRVYDLAGSFNSPGIQVASSAASKSAAKENVKEESSDDEGDAEESSSKSRSSRKSAAKEPEVTDESADGDAMLVDETWEFDGYISGQKERREIISEGDIVFLDIGRKQGIKPMDRFTVYRRDRQMKHPETGESLGHLIRKVGLLEVTRDVLEQTCAARVVLSREPLYTGDYVKKTAVVSKGKKSK